MLDSKLRDLVRFVEGSPTALLQLLISASNKSTFARIVNCPRYPVPDRTPDATSAVKLFKETIAAAEVYPSSVLTLLYRTSRDIKYRKRLGQFFSAAEIADWAFSISTPEKFDSICDAGCGTGIFAESLLRKKIKVVSYIGIENDPILALSAAYILEVLEAPASYIIWYTNYLVVKNNSFKKENLPIPTIIISNPPYIRFHHLHDRGHMLSSLKSGTGIQLSSFSGTFNYFLCKSVELLTNQESKGFSNSTKPRLLFFAPKEAAGSAHSRKLRDDLRINQGWSWQEYSVPEIQSNIDRHRSNTLALFFVFNKSDQIKFETNSPKRDGQNNILGDILEVKRGISTGCNDYFVLADEDVRQHEIPPNRLYPILPTRVSLHDSEISLETWEEFRKTNHRCWLLALPNERIEYFEPSVQEYLKEGLRRGIHSTPTAIRLRAWYSIPIPSKPPDIFITYIFRGSPRFLLNSAGVGHLTNILGGRFHQIITDPKNRIKFIKSLDNAATKWFNLDSPGREYKGGLRKIEPKEMQTLPLDNAQLKFIGYPQKNIKHTNRTLF
jgi:adenine-specific DNA-methyltransferase